MAAKYQNPVLPGTHPDPSVCRVGDDYYLVVSSFEYFPGVPIFHSKDLVHYRQLGYVLTRESQLSLAKSKSSQGVFAATIRHHDGVFYVVTTDVAENCSFYVTATDPAGPWSEPLRVKEDVFTMDPSLFFDDDGRVYYTRHGELRDGAIFQAGIDISTGKLLEAPRQIWRGTGGIWPEGPHLYKVDGTYYLMISEGGTSYDHMITVARSASPFGPFEAFENNPVLTHRDLPAHPIQATGHADLVQTQEGHWWMVLLGIRPSTERHHHIGRETFLAPVTWKDGWPVVNAGKPLELIMSGEGLPPTHPFEAESERDEFDETELRVAWRYVRNPALKNYSLSERPGFLRLFGTNISMSDVGSPTLVVRPQTSLRTRIATELHIEPKTRQLAGLVVRGNEDNHYQLLVEGLGAPGERAVVLRTRIDGKSEDVARRALNPGPVTLTVQGEKSHYSFSFSAGGGAPVTLGSAPTSSFGFEKTGSFTGAFVGLYAHCDGPSPAPADFAWFEMKSIR
jgi:alpha-N-arabinofuranosidase